MQNALTHAEDKLLALALFLDTGIFFLIKDGVIKRKPILSQSENEIIYEEILIG